MKKHLTPLRHQASLVIVLPLIVLLVAACSSESEPAVGPPTPEPGVTVLFALQGKAKFEDGHLVVQTDHVDWFSDRPHRHAGIMPNDTFVQVWDTVGFDSVPPNAFLVGDASDVVVVLTAPEATETGLSFKVGDTLNGTTAVGDLGAVGLFIDSTELVYVANSPGDNVSVIDGTSGTAEPSTGSTDMVYDANRAYVTNSGDGAVSIIDGETNTVIGTIELATPTATP
jgi:YVTN family beta-propeller protein